MNWPLEVAYQFHKFNWITLEDWNQGTSNTFDSDCDKIKKITKKNPSFIKFLFKNHSFKNHFTVNYFSSLDDAFKLLNYSDYSDDEPLHQTRMPAVDRDKKLIEKLQEQLQAFFLDENPAWDHRSTPSRIGTISSFEE